MTWDGVDVADAGNGADGGFETSHRVYAADARSMDALADESVDLVVTSPPYPMIEMWDDLFAELSPESAEHLADGDGPAAHEAMHEVLDAVWAECERVLAPGGIACVNVGDATRSVDGDFRVYPNHARVTAAFEDLGFDPLPDVLWRKPTNSAAKFMGSGMLPTNAYVTLEHEYVLVFRKGERRSFDAHERRRYESAYFWEERNRWFSDVWSDVAGEEQALAAPELRERSGAFPFEIPYRLLNMYSVYGDTVLDPFLGTGTTSLAAMVAGRESVGYEREDGFLEGLEAAVGDVPDLSERVVDRRLADHRAFVDDRRAAGEPLEYEATHYDFPVVTRQERDVRFYRVDDVEGPDSVGDATARYRLDHRSVESAPARRDGAAAED